MSRMTITPVSRSLNGTIVSCFEGSSSTESVATTTIYIIGGEEYNVHKKFLQLMLIIVSLLSLHDHPWCLYHSLCCFSGNVNSINSVLAVWTLYEQFLSDGISIVLEWNISNVQIYHQMNVSIAVVPSPIAVMHARNRTLQLILSYNTLYNVSLTQPGICGQPNQTSFIELISIFTNRCK